MQILDSKKWLLLVSVVSLVAFGVTSSIAQEKIKITGKITATVTESSAIKIGDLEGHTFLISRSEGTSASTGKNQFMDGALVVNHNFSDLIKGNGSHEGYVIFSKDGDNVTAAWKGKVTTTISSGNVPMTTMEGTYTYTKATFHSENIQGGGNYKGKYISDKTYVVEWEGEYSAKR